MNKLINYLKKEKFTLIFEVIVVVIGMILALTADSIREEYKENQKIQEVFRNDKGKSFGRRTKALSDSEI